MNITNITNSVTAGMMTANKPEAVAAQKAADPVSQALQRADKRVSGDRESTSVQLSSFGRVQSAFADMQGKAAALADPRQTTTATGAANTANAFIKSFNGAVATTQSAVGKEGALADNGRAQIAANDLRRSLNDSTTRADLAKIGITRQTDGTLAIDSKKFEAAQQADPTAVSGTLARVGQQMEGVANRELSATGNIGRSINSLSNRAATLQAQQSQQQAMAAALQQTANSQASQWNDRMATGVEAYRRIFSA